MGNTQVKVRRPAIFREFASASATNVPNSATESFTAEVREEWIDGRRVISSTPYTFPVDPDFMDLNDMNHYSFRKMLNGKNYNAPLKNPKRILDVGAGNGTWIKEMALEFPKAKLFAIDLVEDMYNKAKAATNISWEVGNILEPTRFDTGYFDYVHMRMIIGAIPTPKMPSVCNELYRITKKGGWVTVMDPTNVIHSAGPHMKEWANLLCELCKRSGVNPYVALDYEQYLKNAGFSEVKVIKFNRGAGSWAGDLGAILVDTMMRLTLMMTVMLPDLLTPEAAIRLNQEAFGEECNMHHTECEWIMINARK
jgi:ubiquinone/menaquinone biosynthesis C-methylase UbiE